MNESRIYAFAAEEWIGTLVCHFVAKAILLRLFPIELGEQMPPNRP
jgi:hypothetical protein